jgi:polyhydroxybutyrate depolymerase
LIPTVTAAAAATVPTSNTGPNPNATIMTNNVTNTTEFVKILKHYVGIRHRLPHDGLVRWFVEYPPPPPSSSSSWTTSANDTKVPVLILLHFGTGNMRSSRLFGRVLEKDPWLLLAEQYGYLVLSPNAVAPKRFGTGYNTRSFLSDWNDFLGGRNNTVSTIDDVGFISALVEWAIQERNGDSKRVYIYGYSNGGTMVQRMLIERPNLFAAATSVVANLPEKDVPTPIRGTPLFLMMGTQDDRMPYYGGETNNRGRVRSAEATRDFFVAANQAGPNMIETILPDRDPNDQCRIISQFYPSQNNTPVQFYKLDGGGHNFVGEKRTIGGFPLPNLAVSVIDTFLGNSCYDADGIQLAWDFMMQFTLQS